ncbi:unnamed protein product [Effrenium voratum]|nr:unnamed protein product [Effrenium voratum]
MARTRVWLLALAAVPAFVGPPRDRQPVLDRPDPITLKTTESTREFTELPEPESENKLAKRVRAIAVGSAAGILLSIVVQGVTKNTQEQIPRREYRRVAASSGFAWDTLGTGLVIGLGAGVVIGNKLTDSESTSQKDKPKPHGRQDVKVRTSEPAR